MNESLQTPSGKSGLPPGALVHVGDVLETVTGMSVIDYSKDSFAEHKIHSIDEILKYRESASVTWVIVEGLERRNCRADWLDIWHPSTRTRRYSEHQPAA